jgi:hypothetical protein
MPKTYPSDTAPFRQHKSLSYPYLIFFFHFGLGGKSLQIPFTKKIEPGFTLFEVLEQLEFFSKHKMTLFNYSQLPPGKKSGNFFIALNY